MFSDFFLKLFFPLDRARRHSFFSSVSKLAMIHFDRKIDACYDRGAPLFFLILPLNLGAQDIPLSQKLIFVPKNQNCVRYLYEKSAWSGACASECPRSHGCVSRARYIELASPHARSSETSSAGGACTR